MTGMPSRASISFRDGLVVLRGIDPADAPSDLLRDARIDALVAPGHRMPELRAWAAARGIPEQAGTAPEALDAPFFDPRAPREYQRDAVARWRAAGRRGSVVLPTGAGKTLVALLAVRDANAGAVIVAPTRALVGQWFAQLADAFGGERVGAYYGDEKEVRAITVTTYHSAFALLERWGARFGIVVLDEVHHLADAADGGARAWHDALRVAPAAARLGLTATYPDDRDAELRRLVGPVVYRRAIGEMPDAELARFAVERRYVPLTTTEQARYDALSGTYERWMAARGYRERAPSPADAWRMFVAESRRSPGARRALRAFAERERLVRLAAAKMREVERILRLHPAERAVLFCGGTDAAEAVSRALAVPMVTASTPASERAAILRALDRDELRAVASVRVLDEGWDVPGAKVGIVLGDSTRGAWRQHAQRLGRLLRRQGDAVASLYEIVAAGTFEFYSSQKRGAGLRRAAGGQGGQLGLGV